jgi:hypothetical protein
MHDIGILFDDNAKNVFGTKSSLSHDDSNVRRKQTPWINSKCRTSRKAFHEARKTYNTYKTNVTRKNMYSSSEELIFLKYSCNSVNGTSILDFLAFVHRFSISQNFFGL